MENTQIEEIENAENVENEKPKKIDFSLFGSFVPKSSPTYLSEVSYKDDFGMNRKVFKLALPEEDEQFFKTRKDAEEKLERFRSTVEVTDPTMRLYTLQAVAIQTRRSEKTLRKNRQYFKHGELDILLGGLNSVLEKAAEIWSDLDIEEIKNENCE